MAFWEVKTSARPRESRPGLLHPLPRAVRRSRRTQPPDTAAPMGRRRAHPRLLSPRLGLHGAVRPSTAQSSPPAEGLDRPPQPPSTKTARLARCRTSELTSSPSGHLTALGARCSSATAVGRAGQLIAAGRPGLPSRIPATANTRSVLISGRHYPLPMSLRFWPSRSSRHAHNPFISGSLRRAPLPSPAWLPFLRHMDRVVGSVLQVYTDQP